MVCYRMAWNPVARRRWLGAACLGVTLLLLTASETLLKRVLSPVGFVLIWLSCILLTCMAMLIAFLDAVTVGRQTRKQQRDLLNSTLHEIEQRASAEHKHADSSSAPPKGQVRQ